ncbi:putative membrane protein hemolysin III-like [Paenibacillus pasadenensis]|uniref:Putative membrane protein hemolysin III-like n=1 Tax=Paenibacillus pasadenensis TaxID=217090 RepID=A0A2N5NAM4_9BACL|nr:hemolysin III family protein [Paenibacillus pasadenensis]PLT47409.1 putative membrane protein hemolysin III-like [Paenibacillus pasadenensis]
MANTHTYTRREEVANAITHGIGTALSIAALVVLIVFAAWKGTAMHVVTFTIYGTAMLLLYTASTLVHSFRDGRMKDILEVLDHSFIYVFIAGTYTPLVLHTIGGSLGWTLFGVVWGIAVAGVVFKAYFTKRFLFTSTLLYILMGWIVVFAWGPLTASLAPAGLTLLIAGGLLYTVGTVFYVWRSFPYHHAVWHLFVLAGSIAHFFTILLYVLPR